MKCIVVIFSVLLSISLNSTVLPEELKGTHDVFKQEALYLSPLPGLVWNEGGVLGNLGELWEGNNAIIKLINELFNRINELEFREVRSPTSWAYDLTPMDMGKIAGTLYDLKQHFVENPKDLSELKKTLAIRDPKKRNTAFQKNSLVRDLTYEFNKIKPKLNPLPFIEALMDSNDDISVFKVIGAFVFMKSPTKEELFEYYEGIAASVLKLDEVFLNVDFLSKDKHKWLSESFGNGDITYNTNIPYEQAVFNLLRESNNWLKPYLTSFDTAYPPKGSDYGFPDCGESSLLNLYRVLFGKESDKTIDLDLLNKIGTPTELIDFFTTYKKLEDLRKPEARNAWAGLTVNLSTLYTKKGAYVNRDAYGGNVRPTNMECEINSGFLNLEALLEGLQGKKFDDLIADVNAQTRNNFSINKELDQDGLGKITITTKDRGNFKWLFQKGHFIFRPMVKSAFSNWKISELLKTSQPVKDLISLLPVTSTKLEELKDGPDANYTIFLNKLDNNDDITLFAENVFGDSTSNVKRYVILLRLPEDAQLRIRDYLFELGTSAEINNYLTTLNFLKKNTLLAAKNTYGKTALYYAVDKGDEKIVKLLLAKMSTEAINAKDKYGETMLYYAVRKGDEKIVELLLAEMSTEAINAKNYDGETMLYYAVRKGDEKIVELLLAEMSTEAINAKNYDGETELYHAVNKGDEKIVKLLLAKMSTEAINAKDKYGETMLHFAVDRGNEKIAKLLLANMIPEAINAKNNDGKTALYGAVNKGDEKIAKLLLAEMSTEAIINAKDKYGETTLDFAVNRGNEKIVELLLAKMKMSPEAINAKDKYGKTALYDAVRKGDEKIVELLLAEMSTEAINAKNYDGKTELYHAVNKGDEKIVKLLLAKMSTEAINAKDKYGKTALDYAVDKSNKKIVELLRAK